MAAQNAHENTEEIIDLTELIEKGEVPASTEAAPASVDEDQSGLHSHMRSLNEEGRQADAEIDDLLAQMEARDDSENAPSLDGMPFEAPVNTKEDRAIPPQAHEPAPDTSAALHGHIVDPNEKLHMPGMGDVDTLLNFLDIPPQPSQRGAEASPPHSVDAAVDQMLSGLTGAACPAPARPDGAVNNAHDHTPDVDELLAAGTVPEPVLSDELEALFGASDTATRHTVATPAEHDTPPEESMSAQPQSAAEQSGTAPLPEPDQETDTAFNPEAFAADLDMMLADDKPATETSGADQSAAAKGHDKELDFDLDTVLAAADAEIRESAQPMANTAESPAPQAAPADVQKTAPQAVQPTAEVPAQTEPEDVAQPKADLAQPAAPGEVPDFAQGALSDLDIDALLAQATGDMAAADPLADAPNADSLPAQQVEKTPPAAQAHMDMPTDMPMGTPTDMPTDMPVGTLEESTAFPETADLENNLDDISIAETANAARLAEPAHSADAADTANTANSADTTNAEAATAQSAPAAEAAAASQAPAFAVVAQRLEQCEDLLRQAEERVNALESAVAEARAAAEQARTLADDAREAAGLAQASAEEAQNTARAVARDTASTMDEALQTARHAQEAAETAMQQNSAPDAAHALDQTLFAPGHPLHQRLMDAIQAAAAEAAQQAAQQALHEAAAHTPAAVPDEDPALAERLNNVDLILRSTSARLDSIEERLDGLEPRFNDQVEKSAAAAAARILREEITRLLESEAE